ncbi:unnamed protein product [Protopolystoma xenopodis]|uniref:Uncharacterized protein n=1 Tax=Protopolystoma xenopodis TaxID=117903 RepID=A0A448X1C1_9PLAT|nr:unnamed protein product [Protopolystoma xenopodis]
MWDKDCIFSPKSAQSAQPARNQAVSEPRKLSYSPNPLVTSSHSRHLHPHHHKLPNLGLGDRLADCKAVLWCPDDYVSYVHDLVWKSFVPYCLNSFGLQTYVFVAGFDRAVLSPAASLHSSRTQEENMSRRIPTRIELKERE